ncbi:hypothetical protein DFR55_10577 [Herbinix hemicellulosilytica]|uniref:Cof-like hydrolase n=1 Tax=Herbinix hemicellulosilytica TaxID=1564487 RepID=A0A0H5SWH6_HERHM|nr:HAD family hydrolase [Herbinix hemicellulosilytica]RBP59594.1 hypothetical protein DFR55_10577 [Herbinix hemicellulosilytica]CRZ34693.1 hypothetical protein HHT355_1492 [Herbinix hemicellulosilytica]
MISKLTPKTLYVSDLDGTLLNNNAKISDRSLNIINSLIDKGMLFTVATARSIASVKYILKDLKLTLPVILMNGVCIYDPVNQKYINVETLSKENIRILISLIEENNLKGFMYAVKNEKLSTYYEELSNKALRDFYEIRVKRYKKPFTKVNKFAEIKDEPIIYFVLMDYKEKLEPIYRLVENLPNINSVFYKDNYEKDMWYLEIFSNKASKYHAVQYLRKYLSADYVIGFGDNQNDLSLFEACDKFYAVDNAIEELKQRADAVIGKNSEDGVAMWLKENF